MGTFNGSSVITTALNCLPIGVEVAEGGITVKILPLPNKGLGRVIIVVFWFLGVNMIWLLDDIIGDAMVDVWSALASTIIGVVLVGIWFESANTIILEGSNSWFVGATGSRGGEAGADWCDACKYQEIISTTTLMQTKNIHKKKTYMKSLHS